LRQEKAMICFALFRLSTLVSYPANTSGVGTQQECSQ